MNSTVLSHRQILNRIYKDICGFEISKTDEARVKKSSGSPLYGEINHGSIKSLLEYLDLSKRDVFYDLGSGIGKVVIAVALLSSVKKAVGIELSKTRHKDALEALENASIWAPSINNRCLFLNADLMTADLSSATVIYTCSTAFSIAFMKKVIKRLAILPQDFRLVSLQELPENKHFVLEDILRLDMSWVRKTPVHLYRRA